MCFHFFLMSFDICQSYTFSLAPVTLEPHLLLQVPFSLAEFEGISLRVGSITDLFYFSRGDYLLISCDIMCRHIPYSPWCWEMFPNIFPINHLVLIYYIFYTYLYIYIYVHFYVNAPRRGIRIPRCNHMLLTRSSPSGMRAQSWGRLHHGINNWRYNKQMGIWTCSLQIRLNLNRIFMDFLDLYFV